MSDNRWLLPATLICVLSIVMAGALSLSTGYPAGMRFQFRFALCALVVVGVGLFRLFRYLYSLWRAGVESPIASIKSEWREGFVTFAPIVAGVIIIGLFIQAMSQIKSMIPAVIPFWADDYLLAADNALGIYPDRWAAHIQFAIPTIGVFYMLWHVMNLGGILWVLHWRENKSRLVIAYMLTWSIGMFVAYLVSSAGPIFTGHFNPRLTSDTVRRTTSMLWHIHEHKSATIGAGISAFPSLHVAIATWFAIVLKQRGFALVGALYVAAIFLSSLVLGWHYMLDGVGGALIALVSYDLAQFKNIRRRVPTGPGVLGSMTTP